MIKRKSPISPRFSAEPESGTLQKKIREYRVENQKYSSEECDQELTAMTFSECVFTSVVFTGKARGCELADVIFEHCDFSNIDMRETTTRRVIFDRCRLTGTDLEDSRFEDTEFRNCELSYANLSASKFRRVILKDSNFQDSSFTMAEFKDTDIDHCNFNDAEFLNTSLAGLDLSTSSIERITCSTDAFKGVYVNTEQAVAIAAILGVIVKE